MPSGFFFGGLAEGAENAAKRDLAERTLAQDASFREKQIGLQERQVARAEQNDVIGRVDKQIADTMAVVGETIKSAVAGGRDPAQVIANPAVQSLLSSAKQLAARVGRDPAALDAQVRTLALSPSGTETATAAGKAEGTKTAVAQQTAAGILGKDESGEGGFIIDPAKRGEAENKLRGDYQARSKDFITVRDFKDRIDQAKSTGAGDLNLVFSYMKLLDPASTVREGEFKTATQIAGLPGVIETLRNKILGQGQLSDGARQDIRNAAGDIWRKANERQTALTNAYSAIAKRGGLNPKNVIVDLDSGPATLTTPGGTSFRIIP